MKKVGIIKMGTELEKRGTGGGRSTRSTGRDHVSICKEQEARNVLRLLFSVPVTGAVLAATQHAVSADGGWREKRERQRVPIISCPWLTRSYKKTDSPR